jgi:hypothetical protein
MSDDHDPRRDDQDDELLADLGRALDPDPLPEGLVTRAEGLVVWADVDADLEVLLEQPTSDMAGVRGQAHGSTTTYRLAEVSVEVAVEAARVGGQVLSGTVDAVTLERVARREASTVVDDLGRFAFDAVPTGPARLVLERHAADPLATEWFLV